MQYLVFFIPIFLLSLLLERDPESKDHVIFDRIEYIHNLKFLIEKDVWRGFTDKKFDLPLVYYTDSVCYVANPTEKFIASFQPDLVFENRDIRIYKTPLLDSVKTKILDAELYNWYGSAALPEYLKYHAKIEKIKF